MPACPNCGSTVEHADVFCHQCGANVEHVSDVPTEEQSSGAAQPPAGQPPQHQQDGTTRQPPQTQPGQPQEPRPAGQQPPRHPPGPAQGTPPQESGGHSRRSLLQASAAVLAVGGLAYALQDDDITVPVIEDGEEDNEDTNGDLPQFDDDTVAGSDDAEGATDEQEDDGETVDGSEPYEGWMEGVPNYDGTYDFRGFDEIRIAVGPDEEFQFVPSAVLVDPGTRVVWEWASEAEHSVTHEPMADAQQFDSGVHNDTGYTFDLVFDQTGVYPYYCLPHQGLGMKGVVSVGVVEDELLDPERAPIGGTDPETDGEIELLTYLSNPQLELFVDLLSEELETAIQVQEEVPPDVCLDELVRAESGLGTLGRIDNSFVQEFEIGYVLEQAEPVSMVFSAPTALTVAPEYGDSFEEFIERVRHDDGQVLAVPDIGAIQPPSVAAEVLQREFDLEFERRRFGPQEAFDAVLHSDEVIATTSLLSWAPPDLLEELQILAVFEEERLDWQPDVPTFQEIAGREFPPISYWEGVLAPPRITDDQAAPLVAAIERAISQPELREIVRDSRTQIVYRGPNEVERFIHQQWNLYDEFGEP